MKEGCGPARGREVYTKLDLHTSKGSYCTNSTGQRDGGRGGDSCISQEHGHKQH